MEQLASSEPWCSFPWQISTAISAVGQTSAEVACFYGFRLTLFCATRQSCSGAPRGIRSTGVISTHHRSSQSLRCDVWILWASFTGYATWQFMFSVWRERLGSAGLLALCLPSSVSSVCPAGSPPCPYETCWKHLCLSTTFFLFTYFFFLFLSAILPGQWQLLDL